MNAAPIPAPKMVEQRQAVGVIPSTPTANTEHHKLSAGTADLWRQLAHLCMETP